jgi:Domain of unknown function (DUF4911)
MQHAVFINNCRIKMNDAMVGVCYRIEKKAIGYLRFTLEGYDGLGFIRTLDAGAGLVEIAWPASRGPDMCQLLAALAEEVPMQEVPRPTDYEPI